MNADRHSFSLSFICPVCVNSVMSFSLADLDKSTTPVFNDALFYMVFGLSLVSFAFAGVLAYVWILNCHIMFNSSAK